MEAATVHQLAKRLYKNNTGGYVGVVTLDHNGHEVGTNIEPFGTIWLSDAEAVLTARAPRRPEDNPFAEQTFWAQDPQTGERREVKIRPVTLVSNDARYLPANDRYVPTEVAESVEQLGQESGPPVEQARPTPTPTEAPLSSAPRSPDTTPPAPVAAATPGPAPIPQQGLTGAQEPQEPDVATSWEVAPEAPGRVLRGALSGSDEAQADPALDPTLPQPGDEVTPVPQMIPETPGSKLGAEEHAARVDPAVGEETGAAKPPARPQPQGEYAKAEEVGSPEAPAARDEGLIGE